MRWIFHPFARVPLLGPANQALLFILKDIADRMSEPDRCELHEVAVFAGPEEVETLLRLARSPIGDECQMCAVCRSAREFIELRLAEAQGQVFPPQRNSEAARTELQAAIARAKASMHASL